MSKGDEYVEMIIVDCHRYPLANLPRRGHGCFQIIQVGRLTRRYPALQQTAVRWRDCTGKVGTLVNSSSPLVDLVGFM